MVELVELLFGSGCFVRSVAPGEGSVPAADLFYTSSLLWLLLHIKSFKIREKVYFED